jgi:acyl-CoA dehydrogenase
MGMSFELNEEHRMLRDLVKKFVDDELMPLEKAILEREASGQGAGLTKEEQKRLDGRARELGLAGLDAPEEFDGFNMPVEAMVGVNEELGKTAIQYVFPPDSPNLRMLMLTANDEQKERYLGPYARGELTSAIAISEPGGGGDPASMRTRAVADGGDYLINGRKIWISKGGTADFIILMASTDPTKGAKGITAFLVDQGTKGWIPARRIPMLGGRYTWEIAIEDMRLPKKAVLGEIGNGYGPMQQRLSSRRVQMAAKCCGTVRRALDMMREWVTQRKTFGALLSDRQSIQWWIADAETRLHACRLMTYNTAIKVDRGEMARSECSMIKLYATELAWDVLDNAMQAFGAMGMTKELPLHMMANNIRVARIYEGPSEVHRVLIARYALQGRHVQL